MTKGATRPLFEIREELAQQDAQRARAKARLRAAGEGLNVTLAMPHEAPEGGSFADPSKNITRNIGH